MSKSALDTCISKCRGVGKHVFKKGRSIKKGGHASAGSKAQGHGSASPGRGVQERFCFQQRQACKLQASGSLACTRQGWQPCSQKAAYMVPVLPVRKYLDLHLAQNLPCHRLPDFLDKHMKQWSVMTLLLCCGLVRKMKPFEAQWPSVGMTSPATMLLKPPLHQTCQDKIGFLGGSGSDTVEIIMKYFTQERASYFYVEGVIQVKNQIGQHRPQIA